MTHFCNEKFKKVFTTFNFRLHCCDSYHDVFDIGFLLTRNLQKQRLRMVKLKSPAQKFYGHHRDLANRYRISVTNEHDMVHLSYHNQSFPNSRFITGFATTVTGRVSHVEQELLTLPENRRSPRILVGDVHL